MYQKLNFIYLYLIFAIEPSTSLRSAQVEVAISYGSIGSKETLMCKATTPISICAWKLSSPTEPDIILKHKHFHEDYHDTKDDFEKGICKLEINSIDQTDYGLWNCTLIDNREPVETFHSVIELRPPVKVQKIEIIDKDHLSVIKLKSHEPKNIALKCCAYGGAPSPVLSFFKDGKLRLSKTSTEKETACIEWTGELHWSDHGQDLICLIESHPASNETIKDVLQLNIEYPPLFLRDNDEVIVTDSREGIAKFRITMNPLGDITFMMNDNEGVMRDISLQDEKYKVHATFIKDNLIEEELRVFDLKIEDANHTFLLKAFNQYSEEKLEFKFQFHDTSEDYNLWIKISVGVALFVVIVIIIVVLYHLYKRKMYCFMRGNEYRSGRTSPYETYDGGDELNGANRSVLMSSYKDNWETDVSAV